MADAKRVKLSDQSVNSYGFRVLTAGIDLKQFRKNPVMLDTHYRKTVLGKWSDIQLEDDGSLTAVPVFNSKNANAASREQEFNDGFFNGASLGMIPLEFDKGADKYPQFDNNDIVLSKCKLTEISMCAVPSNDNALALYDKGGNLITEKQLNEIKLSFIKTETSLSKTNLMDKKLLCLTLGIDENSTDTQIQLALQNLKNDHSSFKIKIAALEAEVVPPKKTTSKRWCS